MPAPRSRACWRCATAAAAETFLRLDAKPGPVPATTGEDASVARLLGLAFLGGLILNLMPCVFPVLAIKAAGLAGLAGARRGRAALYGASYTAGVLVTFAALGALLLALRAGGGGAGWGFQFQSPVFVAAIAWLLFAVGLNFSGVFADRRALRRRWGRAWRAARDRSAASSPACSRCWWRAPAPRRSWAPRSPGRLPPRRPPRWGCSWRSGLASRPPMRCWR